MMSRSSRRSRWLVGLLVVFLLAVLVGSVAAIVVLLRDGGGSVEEGSVLIVDLGGSLPEQPLPEQPLPGLGPSDLSMIEIDAGLRMAAVDDRIEQVLVRIKPLAIGYGKAHELRDIITRFSTDSGKPITCWSEMLGNKEFLVGTACDRIFMAPEGFFLVNGLHIGTTFFKGTLDKLGIEAEFTRAGKYKSAIEPLTSKGMSPAFRSMMEALADSLYADLVEPIASSRGLSEAQVTGLIDDPPMTASGAHRAGLIDGLYYRDQLLAALAGEEVASMPSERPHLGLLDPAEEAQEGGEEPDGLTQEAAPPVAEPSAAADDDDSAVAEEVPERGWGAAIRKLDRTYLDDYLEVDPKSLGLGDGPTVAVVYCEGQITSGTSDPNGSSQGSDTIAGAIRRARTDEGVEAIVLRIDSPGGSGLASDVIWREVDLARRVNGKPVVVSMGDLAASGGYYIAMAADTIVAQPTTITGSIGVYSGKLSLEGLYAKVGLTTESVQRGSYADLFSPSKPLGEPGRAKLSQFVDAFYETFVTKAAAGRKTDVQSIHEVAQGRVWTGRQALEIGLVDHLGSFRTALGIAKELAGIEGEASLKLYPRRPNFFEQLLGDKGPRNSLLPYLDRSFPELPSDLRAGTRAAEDLLRAAPLFSTGQPVLMSPYSLDVR